MVEGDFVLPVSINAKTCTNTKCDRNGLDLALREQGQFGMGTKLHPCGQHCTNSNSPDKSILMLILLLTFQVATVGKLDWFLSATQLQVA